MLCDGRSLETKMGHKKMFEGTEVNQRRSDKQDFGFANNSNHNDNANNNYGLLGVHAA